MTSSSLSTQDLITETRQGQRISREDAIRLYQELSLSELGSLAHGARERLIPSETVTYLVDRNINYTNLCHTDCTFCGFYRHDPKHPEAYVLPRPVLAKKIEEALAIGATRILLQGGHNDELPYDFYLDMISWIHETYPIEINSFSPSEIQQMARVSGKSFYDILSDLKARGMKGLPGGGAELLDDETRKRVSPKKISADTWIEVMEVAQSLELTTTATMVIGFGETIEQRMNHYDRLRNLQDRSLAQGYPGFGAFISWTLQHNENTSVGRSKRANEMGASALEYLRNTALARIYLDNVPHHQASWPTLGVDIAKVALHFGCDDFGSTMMEENVVSQAGAPTKERWSMSPEELRYHIKDAGFIPAQRNSSYDLVQLAA